MLEVRGEAFAVVPQLVDLNPRRHCRIGREAVIAAAALLLACRHLHVGGQRYRAIAIFLAGEPEGTVKPNVPALEFTLL